MLLVDKTRDEIILVVVVVVHIFFVWLGDTVKSFLRSTIGQEEG